MPWRLGGPCPKGRSSLAPGVSFMRSKKRSRSFMRASTMRLSLSSAMSAGVYAADHIAVPGPHLYPCAAMCGIFGVFGHPEAANLSYLGIHALQHRGQESAGIASWDGSTIHLHKAMGLVADIFDQQAIAGLPGLSAIGHSRYSTAGQSVLANAQPMVARTTAGQIAVAHNGNLVNADELRQELAARGALFSGTSDTEVIVHLLAHQTHGSIEDRIRGALASVRGAYS